MTKNLRWRSTNIDFIRCLAVWSVLSVHFFLNNGFYDGIIEGKRMFVMVFMRTFFMICVPLFLLITGYLMNSKEISKKYYKGIIRTISIYFLTSILCIGYKYLYLSENVTIKEGILKIFSFQGASYSWYVDMYIGLFLIIPFLNICWKGLENKKSRQALIITMLLITALPSVMNIWNFNIQGFGIMPSVTGEYTPLVPTWWSFMYPITYYYIGAYLKVYGFNMRIKKSVLLLGLSVMIFGGFNCFRNYGRVFSWGILTDYASLQNVINSVLIFGIALQLPLEKVPYTIKKIISLVSKNALGIYLVSEIFDKTFYPVLAERIPLVQDRLEYYFIIVPVCFVCSFIMAQIISWIYEGLEMLVKRLKDMYNNKNHYNVLE